MLIHCNCTKAFSGYRNTAFIVQAGMDQFYEWVCPMHGRVQHKHYYKEDFPEMKSAFEHQENGSHYKDFVIQPSDYNAKNKIPWYEANAIKYLSRHAHKDEAQDLKKAIHYCRLALESYYGIKSHIEYQEKTN